MLILFIGPGGIRTLVRNNLVQAPYCHFPTTQGPRGVIGLFIPKLNRLPSTIPACLKRARNAGVTSLLQAFSAKVTRAKVPGIRFRRTRRPAPAAGHQRCPSAKRRPAAICWQLWFCAGLTPSAPGGQHALTSLSRRNLSGP